MQRMSKQLRDRGRYISEFEATLFYTMSSGITIST